MSRSMRVDVEGRRLAYEIVAAVVLPVFGEYARG